MKRMKEFGILFLPISAIIVSITTIVSALLINHAFSSQATGGELQIFFNQQALILYVPDTVTSLEGFAFEVTYDETQRRLVGLNEFSETAKFSNPNFPSPVCISFSLTGGSLFTLPECLDVTKI